MTNLPLSFLLCTLTARLTYATTQLQRRSTCSNFTILPTDNGPSYTQPGLQTFIISKGVTCTGTQECTVPAGGFVTDSRTLNISSSSASDIFALISSATNITFEESKTGNITTRSWPIANGTSGHVGFTPNHRCTVGVLGGCDEGLSDGTVVEACTPYISSGASEDDAYPALSGTVAAITTDAQSANSLTCNPANTTDPAAAPDETCSTGASATTSAAEATETANGAGSLIGGGLSGAVFVVCIGLTSVAASWL